MSTRVTTFRIIIRNHATVAATYETYQAGRNDFDPYGHHYRLGLRVHWQVSDGRDGPVLDAGSAWTRDGAVGKAMAAAHSPNLGRGAPC